MKIKTSHCLMITQNSFKMLRNLRYKIFGAASNEDIKELLLGMVFTTAVLAGLIIGLNLVDILR